MADSFKGGEKLNARLSEIGRLVTKSGTVRVGFLEGGTYPNGTSTPMVAAIQEFGAPGAGIPPRPFMRPMVAQHKGEWGDQLAAALKASDYDSTIALGQMGEVMSAEIQQAIVDVDTPALSPVTLMLRKMKSEDQALVVTRRTVGIAARRVAAGEGTSGVNTKPLDETGNLIRSVASEVKT